MSETIVIVDDQPEVRRLLSEILDGRGKKPVTFDNGDDAVRFVGSNEPQIELVILDLDLGSGNRDGIEVCADLAQRHPDLPIIMLTGHGTVDDAVRAVKAGATDFIIKDPYLEDKIDLSVDKVERLMAQVRARKKLEGEMAELRAINERLRQSVGEKWRIVGESPAISDVMTKIERVAPVPRPILILGERGTGKELVARAVHNLSPRATNPYVTINCAAVAENLLESEMFGHEQGAFTGATKQKEGKFELADGGTLFLDEIGNMSMDFQAKILRVIEYQRFERVAGSDSVQVDVRVIGATNADLPTMMKEGKFREDLYDRLAFEVIRLPPLRERKEDIPLLAAHFLEKFRRDLSWLAVKRFSESALKRLATYDFPGNVREFKNIAERAMYSAKGDEVTASDVEQALPRAGSGQAGNSDFADDPSLPLGERVDLFEKTICAAALAQARYNQKEAASLLQLTYDQFRQRYRKYGLGKDKK